MAEPAEESPDDLIMSDHVMRLAFHPENEIIAASSVSGEVCICQYSLQGNHQLALLDHHKLSTRALQFSLDGKSLFMGSKDTSVSCYDMNAGKVSGVMNNAHEAPVNAMLVMDDKFLATGDDEGVIKLWDLRQQRCCHELREHEDYISEITMASDGKTMLCTGGDGYLSVWNRKSGKLIAMSDQMEDEFLSISIVKRGKKVVCGTQSGILAIFSWGDWGDFNDRFVGHPQSVESMVKVDEDTLITCSEDGIIRVISVMPNKLLGVIGEHDGCPVEHIQMSHDNKFLASSSHDNTVRFWNISYLFEEDVREQVKSTSIF
ncbi:hypothetical protein GUITHDRAFT_86068 [Guillardia theta CCMP2712]|uniref:Uncharacterized protein n=1 Tax=Guillardia theta (strain CCMP2712) TaxID=905079 RepID=L1JID5_GUITC|nr:hypothetical protein GUITHDRAFT_86068 [Guillardia theta CCMP2712]EKX48261.1 hypothetical protein GUITHDRAFT_86068 [Guillardia theta CCMP2712]|eukprot:XP_005835241.1 hypothetical protein GUITHDRAFT_86068 [Guillardia theta CCMP2712]